ncbi:MAG: FHA domain-containing protein [Gammaproteobacteria bacterium]|nr:FHA domain-containing protein [Gammaproteobacteria bacterium]
MRVQVQFLSRSGDGATKRRDKVFETDKVTLGRGTDQTIHLRDPSTSLEHATLVGRDDRLILRGLTITGVLVNEKMTRQAVLQPGDKIKIGENLLTVIEPTEGFDFSLTFELDPEASAAAAAPPEYQTRLSDAGLKPRKWAWISAIAVLAIFLVVPLLVFFNQSTAELLRDTPLPDDGVWLSGPLHNVHRSIGEDCSACHTPFRRTPNRLCMDCHADVTKHISHSDGVAHEQLSERRCAECHKEHNEPSILVLRDQIVCTDCHANIEEYASNTELRNVSGFVVGHADFHVSMLVRGEAWDQWETLRVPLSDSTTEENSGLKFPHSKHLDPDGIKGAEGDEVLQCESCHLPQGGGAVMRAMNMERDCQRCHQLDFEESDPQRQVPHAQTDVVLKDMEEYYAWRYLSGLEDTTELGIDPSVFRRPGKVTDRGARERLTQAATERASEVGDDLIRVRTCANCHETVATDDWPGIRVVPARLTERWLPLANFDHAPHKSFECVDCHAAETSEHSSDILMPDIYSCGDCHAGSETSGKVHSACIDCHGFHMDGAGAWSD